MNILMLITQKQNNAEYQSKLAAYQTAQQKHQEELAAWRNSHSDTSNPNGVSASSVQILLSSAYHRRMHFIVLLYLATRLTAFGITT